MATIIRWDDYNTNRTMPAGIYNLRIETANIGIKEYDGCKQITLILKVEQPVASAEKTIYEFLQLGRTPVSERKSGWDDDFWEYLQINDPNFENPTVIAKSASLKKFKQIMEYSGYKFPSESSLEDVVRQAEGRRVTAHISIEIAKSGKMKGQEVNVIDAYYPYGAHEPNIDKGKKVTTLPPAKVTPMARPSLSPTVAFYDDDEREDFPA